MANRELQFVDGKSRKFWVIVLKGKSHAVTFGRVGTSGQTRTKDFDTTQEAKKSYEKLVQQKLKKGYVDAKKSSSTKTAAKKTTKKSSPAKNKARRVRRSTDRVAKEFAEIKARKISAKQLIWSFCLSAANEEQRQAATVRCVEFLAGILGKRRRVDLEDSTFDRKKLQHIFLKIPTPTPDLLRKLDRGMADCCKGIKVKCNFVGYLEEIYPRDSWKTLGTVLRPDKPSVESIGDLDCRELRYDGLYCSHYNSDGAGAYLRFYPDGEYVSADVAGLEDAVGDGSVRDVARWLRREDKDRSVGTFTLKVKSLRGECHLESTPGEEPYLFTIKARLTKQGLKVRSWSSYWNDETDMIYVFHKLKLR